MDRVDKLLENIEGKEVFYLGLVGNCIFNNYKQTEDKTGVKFFSKFDKEFYFSLEDIEESNDLYIIDTIQSLNEITKEDMVLTENFYIYCAKGVNKSENMVLCNNGGVLFHEDIKGKLTPIKQYLPSETLTFSHYYLEYATPEDIAGHISENTKLYKFNDSVLLPFDSDKYTFSDVKNLCLNKKLFTIKTN